MLLQDKQRIMDNVCKMVPSLQNAEVVQDWVGLRPYREPVRLELDQYKASSTLLLTPVTHLAAVKIRDTWAAFKRCYTGHTA